MFAFTCTDKVHDGRITIEEFLNFFGGFESHWTIQVPSNFPRSFKEVVIVLLKLEMSSIFENLKHFVENRLRTEIELEKLRLIFAKKNANYAQMFSLFSDSISGADKPTFLRKSKVMGLSDEEADFFFHYLDKVPANGEVYFSEFMREFAPSALGVQL